MKIAEKNQRLLEKELREKKAKEQEEIERKEYLATMRVNRAFRKHVIDGVIRKNLEEITDLNRIPSNGNYEEMGKLLFEAKAIKGRLEKMLSDILNG